MTEGMTLHYMPDLIEGQAGALGKKPYIMYEDGTISFEEYNCATCRAANGMAASGAKEGDGLAILMGNCPEYLYLFYGLPRAGFYTVPVNVSLKGEGLKYILTHSDVKYLAVDDTLYPGVAELGLPLGAIKKIFVRRSAGGALPEGTADLKYLLAASPDKPKIGRAHV